MKEIIKKGDKYNRLTAIEFDHKDKKSNLYWLWECNCGVKKVIQVSSVKIGLTKSCGCLQKEVAIRTFTTHGMSYSKTYSSWHHMKIRCLNLKHNYYKDYGGRGIKICDRWMKFDNFLEDMGERPKNKTLDRIDNEEGYYKENCRWATRREQDNNKRSNHLLTYNGKTTTIAEWSLEVGINYNTLRKRLKLNWGIEKALFQPIKK